MATSTFSRRTLGRLLGTGFAAAALRPALAGNTARARKAADGVVRLSANENPYGPSPAALQAMRDAFALAWRYPDEAAGELIAELAKVHAMADDCFLVGDGSSEILKLAASAFTDPSRKLVMAAPTFEAVAIYARVRGAPIAAVPLDAAHAHDLQAMAAQAAGASLIYICNPNNPTASITPKGKLLAFLKSIPPSTVALVDEAYHHYADGPDYQSVIPLVRTQPNLIVARTFSKIYGMAGLRLGYAVAQPPLIQKLAEQGAWDSVNVLALAAGRASIVDSAHAAAGKQRNSATRAQVVGELDRLGYKFIPSQANFIMIDLRKEVTPVIAALRERGVQVGRLFPALPNHLRVTIGKPEQMDRFLEALAAVMA